MAENTAERNVLDAIRQHTENVGKDQSVIDLAEKAIRASGFTIPLLDELMRKVTKSDTLTTGLVEITESAESQRQVEPPKYYPAISEADELERQREEATERIAVPLGIDRNKFLAKLPVRFPDRPAIYEERALTVPLISPDLTPFGLTWLQVTEDVNFYDPNDPVSTLKAYIWIELRNMTNKGELKIWRDPRRGVRPFPQVPHGVWIQDGSRYVDRKPVDVRGKLHKLERAGDHWKGTGLSVLRPDMVKTMRWDLIGGQVGSDYALCVRWSGDRPRFSCRWAGRAVPLFRALVCGSEFTVA